MAEQFEMEFYYLRQDDDFSRPFHRNVIGVSPNLEFGKANGRHVDE